MNTLIADVNRRLENSSKALNFFLACGLLAGIVFCDLSVGVKVPLVMLHWLPIAFATWYVGAGGGLAMTLLSACATVFMHKHDAPQFWDIYSIGWDTAIRGTSSCFFVWALFNLGKTQRREAAIRREAQEAAGRLKFSMLTLMSREINNSITVLETAVHLMKEGGPASALPRGSSWTALDQTLAKMQSASRRFIDQARMESARLSERLEAVDLESLIDGVVEMFQPLMSQRGLALKREAPHGRTKVWADRAALSLILSNLVSNAVKYTRNGGSIAVRVECSDAADSQAIVSVADTGDGISAERLKALQASRPTENADEGLRLVRDLLRLHNSLLVIRSSPGSGSSFSFGLTQVSSRP